MGTTADKLNLLLQTKADIKAALIEKGQTVDDNTPFSAYANKIREISVPTPVIWWSPHMTSNTTPAPYVASANSAYKEADTTQPYNAFDGENIVENRYWYSNLANSWIKFDFGNQIKKVFGMRLYPSKYDSNAALLFPKIFSIQVSDDNSVWDTIISMDGTQNHDPLSLEPEAFVFDTPKMYRYYKVSSSLSYNASIPYQTCISEIEFLTEAVTTGSANISVEPEVSV